MKVSTLFGVVATLGVPSLGWTVYVIDDGVPETAIGTATPFDMLATNSFVAGAGEETITSIQAWFGKSGGNGVSPLGLSFSAYLWLDSNQDGIPDDNGVLSTLATTVTVAYTGFQTIDIPDVTLAVGQGFVVGTIIHKPAILCYPSAVDTTAPHFAHRSFVASAALNTMNPNQISLIPASDKGYNEVFFGSPNNNMIRAIGSPVPEPVTIWAMSLGLFLLKRRTKQA